MSEAVICDECGKVLMRSDVVHCADAMVSNSDHNLVYGADICKSCADKFDMKYDHYGWHARPKKESEVAKCTGR